MGWYLMYTSIKGLLMNLSEITIRVSDELAAAYRAASEEDRRKIDLLLSLRLGEALESPDSLREVVRRVSESARARGMTEDVLSTLLNGQ